MLYQNEIQNITTKDVLQKPRTEYFKAMSWSFEDKPSEDGNVIYIYVTGRTIENKTIFIKIIEFKPYLYLELPPLSKGVPWTQGKCNAVFDYFCKVLDRGAPLKYTAHQRVLMKDKREINCILLYFASEKDCKSFAWRAKNAHYIPRVGNFERGQLQTHEHHIDPIIKYTATKHLELAGWLKVKETIHQDDKYYEPEDRKIATTEIDMCAKWNDIEPYTPNEITLVYPSYCSFDIECYSKNHNSKLPDAHTIENEIICVVCEFGYLGKEEKEVIILTLKNPKNIPDSKVVRFKDERQLILGFTTLIQEKDPDVFIGHNIMKFDWDYMITRASIRGVLAKFMKLTRILDVEAKRAEIKWASSGAGYQSFGYPDCVGRLMLDTLIEIERNYRLPIYSLSAVSKRFLKGETKDDISPRQLFMIYQLTCETDKLCKQNNSLVSPTNKKSSKKTTVTEETLTIIKKRTREILLARRVHGPSKKWRKAILKSTVNTVVEILRDGLTLVCAYCKQDTNLPVKLVKILCIYETMEQMSNTMGIPMSYLGTRGQQIKVIAQVYREALKDNIAIHAKQVIDVAEKYQGATVVEAHPGHYLHVICLDFASLYPSIIILLNICLTTFIDDTTVEGRAISDDKCNIIEWESHVKCEHDPLRRKGKKEDIICGKYRFRFRKIQLLLDENDNLMRTGEGILPRMLRTLLAKRKEVKKDMFKDDSRLAMNKGTATEGDIAYFKKCGFEIIEPDSLPKKEEEILKVVAGSKNAKQLSIKIVANSAYGGTGAQTGYIYSYPCCSSVTATGRRLIDLVVKKVKWMYKDCDENSPTYCKLVYGDTDSALITFPNANLEQTFELGNIVSKIVTHYLKCLFIGVDENFVVTTVVTPTDDTFRSYKLNQINPVHKDFPFLSKEHKLLVHTYFQSPLDLEFENVYDKYLLLSKKRYMASMINKSGKMLGWVDKGVCLVRRDNCEYLRSCYKMTKDSILENQTKQQIYYDLYDNVHKLFTMQIPDTKLIIYTGIGDLMSYAKKQKVTKNNIVTFVTANGKAFDPIGPLDPRLVYNNIPHVLLAKKMIERGTDVPPNTRLEYLYLKAAAGVRQGDKAEDFSFYQETKYYNHSAPDYLHYIEKQLCKPYTELLNVKYKGEVVVYEKLQDAVKRVFTSKDLNPLKQQRLVKDAKEHIKMRSGESLDIEDTPLIGWDEYREDRGHYTERDWSKHVLNYRDSFVVADDRKFLHYNLKGMDQKVDYVLASVKEGGKNAFSYTNQEEIDLINVCKRYAARRVIDNIHVTNGRKKRGHYKPSQSGNKLKVKTHVMLLKDVGDYKKGELAVIIIRDEIDSEGNVIQPVIITAKGLQPKTRAIKAKDMIFRYALMFNNNESNVEKNVSRDSFVTYYRRDSFIMRDILSARFAYHEIVQHLNSLFTATTYGDDDTIDERFLG